MVYGGSFDPPHRGHAQLLLCAMAHSWPERAYVVPAFQSVLKCGHYGDIRDRLAMLTLTFSIDSPFKIIVSDLEAKANRKMFTWEVLDYFSTIHPGHEIQFLAGDDCLGEFTRWARADYLAARYTFLVGSRGKERVQIPTSGLLPRVEQVPLRTPDTVSSSRVRELLMDGKSVSGMVNPTVEDYIKSHSLYGQVERVVARNEE